MTPEFTVVQLTYSHMLGTSTLKLITLATSNKSGNLTPSFTKYKLSKHGLSWQKSSLLLIRPFRMYSQDTFCPCYPSCLRWQVYKHCLHPPQKKTLTSTAAHVAQQLGLPKNQHVVYFLQKDMSISFRCFRNKRPFRKNLKLL